MTRKINTNCKQIPSRKDPINKVHQIPNQTIFTCNTSEAGLPKVQVNIVPITILGVVDSGAGISLVCQKAFEAIKERQSVNYISRQVKIPPFTHQTINYTKCIEINFKI